MKLHKWSDTLAKSKLSPERRARITLEAQNELLAIGPDEQAELAGATKAEKPMKRH